MAGILKQNADWIWRIVMILMVAGQYYLQSMFVPRSEFISEKAAALKQYQEERDSAQRQYQDDKRVWWERLASINGTLGDLNVTMRLFEANKATIADHETRIRALERALK